MGLKALFIGGAGIISSACPEMAIGRGIDLMIASQESVRPRLASHLANGAKHSV